MASLMEALIEVLEKENLEYRNLLELSMKKTPVIVSDDVKALAQITDEEQIIVSRINHLDNQRNEAVNDIANVLNKDVTKLKIADLIKMLAARPQEQAKLASVFDELRRNVRAVKQVNERNRELIESALEMVQSGDINLDCDKLIDRQLERSGISVISGFARIFKDAVSGLDCGA